MIYRANAEAGSSELFGKYRLLRVVGTGGMGVVHEALYCPEGGFERQVAVKLIHQHLAHRAGGLGNADLVAARLVDLHLAHGAGVPH